MGWKGVKTTGRKTGEWAMSGGSEGLAGLFLSPCQKVGSPGLRVSAAAGY